jgi:TRAP-type C4-dicarboxylate transport system permease large subunit
VLPIMTPVLLIGGMTSGVFTATRARSPPASGRCSRHLLVPDPELEDADQVSMDTVETTSTCWIVAAASIFRMDGDAHHGDDYRGYWHSPRIRGCLAAANLLMLFVGCFLEPTAAITILVPILLPIVKQLGIDPVHFGLIMVLNLMIGLLHPPMDGAVVLARGPNFHRTDDNGDPPRLLPLLVSLGWCLSCRRSAWLPRQFQ